VKLDQSHLQRRQFLGNMLCCGGAALGTAAAVPLVQYAGNSRRQPPPDYLVIDPVDYQLPPGTSKLLLYGSIPVLLLMTPAPQSELRIFVATCTHLNCTVSYRAEKNCIFCACHEGYYDLAGRVVAGPPPQPLRTFFSKISGGKLVIALEKENLEKASANLLGKSTRS
jgi:nitrite reductase/ring-hydroxylating ferredoxin subunit